MPAGLSFGDVLEEALADTTARTAGAGIATVALMSGPLLTSRARPAYAAWGCAPPPSRRPHPLTLREREAFNRLQTAGAVLSFSFTADELRRVFRRLARELHPDRHLALSAAEHARLGRRFAAMREDYLVLRRAIST